MSLFRIINSILSHFNLALVNNSALYDWQKGEVEVKKSVSCPDGSEEYLTTRNPRLLELRMRYKKFQEEATVPIVWTDEYVKSYDLLSFRGDNCYVWQIGDPNCAEINYCLTAYYAHSMDKIGVLEKNREDGLFGVYSHSINSELFSRDLLDSVAELNFLEKHLGLSSLERFTMLDIGAGYGRLAYRTAKTFQNISKYICTDAVPESTFISEYHIKYRKLENKVDVVPLDEINEKVSKINIDLAVNIHSFSECSLEAIEWWLSLISRTGVKNLFIVPNASDHGGVKLALNSGEDFSFLVEKYGYKLKVKAPKYEDPMIQKYGVSPTYYYLYSLEK